MVKAKRAAEQASDGETKGNRALRRTFDRQAGVAVAKELFHERGFDAVGVAELTRALDINPPSLYAAYGSKAGLFERCLAMYVEEENLQADRILVAGRPLHEAVSELFVRATELYTRSQTHCGCMVAEGMRADDEQARSFAKVHGDAAAAFIECFIAQSEPEHASVLADYVVITLRGLSSSARVGMDRPRLLLAAELAGQAFQALLLLQRDQKNESD
ncbi:MAG TPA: helix-turn-helix domain-containing protein [Telluria sp.]